VPLGPGVRYRVKTSPSGKKTRLAFRGGKVVEAKSMKSVLADHIRKGRLKKKKQR
jgi:hypothetical protein